MNFLKIVLLFIAITGLITVSSRVGNIKNQYEKDLRQIETDLKEIELEQNKIKEHLDQFKDGVKSSLGKASYYDYILKDGWSSKGHNVCANRDYPRGTTLIVKNLENGKTVQCLITDFGPDKAIHPDRIIDLSSYAFSQIADIDRGIIPVQVLPLNK